MIATRLRRVCVLSGMAIVLISGVIGCRSGKLSNPFVRNQTVTTNTATPPTPPPGVAGTPVGDSSSFLSSGTTSGTTMMGTTPAMPIAGGGTVVANGPVVTGGSNVSSGGDGVPGSTASMMTPMPNPQNTTNTQTTVNPSLPTSGAVSSYRVPTDSVSPVSVALPASTMNTASSANGVTLENTMRGSSVVTSAGQVTASSDSHLSGYSTGGSAIFPSAASSTVNTSTPGATTGNDSGVWNVGNPPNMVDGIPVDNTYAGTASGSVQNSAMPTGQPLDPPVPSNQASSLPSNTTSSNSVANSNAPSRASGVTSNSTASSSTNNSPTSGTTTLYYPNETETNRATENNSAQDSTGQTAPTLATTDTNGTTASNVAIGTTGPNNGTTSTSDPMPTDIAIPEVLKQLGQTENLDWVTKSDGLHLIVGTDRLFASQTTDWTSDAKPLAEKIWKAIQTAAADTSTSTDLNLSTDAKIQIIGYTDSSQNVTELANGSTPTPEASGGTSDEESRRLSELSAKQASAMRDFAVTASYFAQDRFEILGRGDAEPRFSNGTEKGRVGNRRLEIVLPRKNS